MRTEIELLLIGIGGAIGAVSRFGIAELAKRYFAGPFPLGTLIANLAGCFLIGILLGSGHAEKNEPLRFCLLYTSPSPRDATLSRMPSSA